MQQHYLRKALIQRTLEAVGVGVLMVPLILYAIPHWQRPPRTNETRSLFQGVTYQREARSTPRLLMIHIVKIDLTAPGIGVLVTPGNPTPDDTEINARTTSEFLTEFKLQLAVNANYFYPFREETPWDFYPHSGDRVNAVGQAISNGSQYSKPFKDWPVLCFSTNNQAQILPQACPQGTTQAVSGSTVIVSEGKPAMLGINLPDSGGFYSRTIAAIDQKGETLWIIAVDDKQMLYSEGATLAEMAEIAIQQGAYTALNLDGGGSTTLAIATPTGAQVLNAPIHTKIPMRERTLANHLGFYAKPLVQAGTSK
jgi:hypothetical protein